MLFAIALQFDKLEISCDGHQVYSMVGVATGLRGAGVSYHWVCRSLCHSSLDTDYS